MLVFSSPQFDPNDLQGGEGLGFGLFISKAIVELHGGSIEARSEGPGKGSVFIFRVPMRRVPTPAAGATNTTRARALVTPPTPIPAAAGGRQAEAEADAEAEAQADAVLRLGMREAISVPSSMRELLARPHQHSIVSHHSAGRRRGGGSVKSAKGPALRPPRCALVGPSPWVSSSLTPQHTHTHSGVHK